MKRSVIAVVPVLLALAGCAGIQVRATPDVHLKADATWVVLPLANRTTTPEAGLRAQAIIEADLAQHGVQDVRMYQPSGEQDALFDTDSDQSRQAEQAWVASQNARYVVSGVVHEWRYKSGVDGEPAVGVMLRVRGPDGKLLYSGTASRAGWARQSLGETGQSVIDALLAPVVR